MTASGNEPLPTDREMSYTEFNEFLAKKRATGFRTSGYEPTHASAMTNAQMGAEMSAIAQQAKEEIRSLVGSGIAKDDAEALAMLKARQTERRLELLDKHQAILKKIEELTPVVERMADRYPEAIAALQEVRDHFERSLRESDRDSETTD